MPLYAAHIHFFRTCQDFVLQLDTCSCLGHINWMLHKSGDSKPLETDHFSKSPGPFPDMHGSQEVARQIGSLVSLMVSLRCFLKVSLKKRNFGRVRGAWMSPGSLTPGSHLPLCTDMDGFNSRQMGRRKHAEQRWTFACLVSLAICCWWTINQRTSHIIAGFLRKNTRW